MDRNSVMPYLYRIRLMKLALSVIALLSFSSMVVQAATQTFVLGNVVKKGGPTADGSNTLIYPSGRTVYFSQTNTLSPANVTINWNGNHGSSKSSNLLYCTELGATSSNTLSIESGLVSAGSYAGVDIFKTNITGLYFSLKLRSFNAYALDITAPSVTIKDGTLHDVISIHDPGHTCSSATTDGYGYNGLGGLSFYSAITFYTDQTYTPSSSKIDLLKEGGYHLRIGNENPGAGIDSYYQNVTFDISAVTVAAPTCSTLPVASGNSVSGTTVNLGSYSPKQIIDGAPPVPFSIKLAGCKGLRNINVTLTTTTTATDKTQLGNILTLNHATGVGLEIRGAANNYNAEMLMIPNESTSVYNDQRNTSGDDNIYGTSENGKVQTHTLNFLATLKRDSNQHIGSGKFKANAIFTMDYP